MRDIVVMQAVCTRVCEVLITLWPLAHIYPHIPKSRCFGNKTPHRFFGLLVRSNYISLQIQSGSFKVTPPSILSGAYSGWKMNKNSLQIGYSADSIWLYLEAGGRTIKSSTEKKTPASCGRFTPGLSECQWTLITLISDWKTLRFCTRYRSVWYHTDRSDTVKFWKKPFTDDVPPVPVRSGCFARVR